MTIDEVLDFVHNTLSFDCSISNRLSKNAVRIHIERVALPMFYRRYQDGVQKMYYHISKNAFETEEFTKYKYITLPCEIQEVTWVYPLKTTSIWNMGVSMPNVSLQSGTLVNTQLSPYVSTIGDIGVYKAIIESFSDMLDVYNRHTVKRSFNTLTKRLHILTDLSNDIILECDVNIPPEDLYDDPYFLRYIVGWAKQQLGNLIGRLDITYQGNVKYSYNDLITQGTEEMQKVWEEIEGMSKVAWFYMVKR